VFLKLNEEGHIKECLEWLSGKRKLSEREAEKKSSLKTE
jgi:hypothetical protein